MATMRTWDGGAEDAAAFARWLIWREPELAGQHPSFFVELYPTDFLRWRVLRFMHEGFEEIAILSLIGASTPMWEAAAKDRMYVRDHFTDWSMQPFVLELMALSDLPGSVR